MITCPNCGATNDDANRFCEQCGSQLAGTAAPAAADVSAAVPAATTAVGTCPNCGATVLPGEAFCDECGSPLAPPSVDPAAQALDATTNVAAPADVTPPADPAVNSADAATVLTPAPAEDSAPAQSQPAADDAAAQPSLEAAMTQASPAAQAADDSGDAAAPADDSAPAADTSAPAADDSAPAADTSAPAADDSAPTADTSAPTADTSAPASSGMDQAAYDAERQRLEQDMARHQQVISQLEPVQQALGDATPSGVADSLASARAGLQKAQDELSALQPPAPAAPAVDPAEVARLQAQIDAQRKIISQLEPVQQALGDATPSGVADSLSSARAALQQAEDALSALGVTASPTVESSGAPAPQVDELAAQAQSQSMPTVDQTPAADQVVATPAPAAPVGPRLLFDNGAELVLPTDKQEVVVGREDPISGIFPEVDLTAHGGESGGVSRQHARLSKQGATWVITDLNSTNYTRIDGTRLEANTPHELKDGMKIQFGRVAVTFRA